MALEQREETVREAISRRALDGAVRLCERLNAGGSVAELHLAFQVLYETMLPFMTPDVKQAMTDMMRQWDEELRQAGNREVLEAHAGRGVPPSSEAW